MRKIMNKMIAFLLCLSMVLCMAACGEKNEENTSGEDTKDKVVIRVGVLNDTSEIALMRQFKEAFEKENQDISIKIVTMPYSDYVQSMGMFSMDTQSMPDVVWTSGEQHQSWSSQGWFVDLMPYVTKDNVDLSEYYDSMIATTHLSAGDTSMWFAPRDYNKPVVMINTEMFDEAGIDYKQYYDGWTMEEFENVCKILREKMDANTNAKIGLRKTSFPCDARMSWNASYLSFIAHYGGKLLEGKTILIDSDSNMNAYESIYSFVEKDYFSNHLTEGENLFMKKNAAMWVTTRPSLPSVEGKNISVDFLPMPTEYIGIGCSGYAITKEALTRTSEDVENALTNDQYAWRFIKWIISEEGQEIFSQSGSGVPVLKSLSETGSWLSYLDEGLNHKAFTMFSDRDISVNIYSAFEPEDCSELLANVSSIFTYIYDSEYWENDAAGLKKELQSIKETLEEF